MSIRDTKGFVVFDIETVVDHDFMYETSKKFKGSDNGIPKWESREDCDLRLYKLHCEEKDGTLKQDCFRPARFHKPVAYVMIALDTSMRYKGYQAFYSTDARAVTERFWGDLLTFRKLPIDCGTPVSFNGKEFDITTMEVNALRYGVELSFWFQSLGLATWQDYRSSSPGSHQHLDLRQYLPGGKIGGDLSFWARALGAPGKLDTCGGDISSLVASFQEDTILDYCICDALNTTKILMELSRHIAAGDTDHTRVHPTPAFIRDEFDSMIRTIIGTRMAEGSKATELMEFWQRYRAMPQPPE